MKSIYNPVLRINLEKFKKVYWPLVVLVLSRYFGVTDEIIFMISGCFICYMIVLGRSIIVPNISGLPLYLAFIIYATVIGLVLNSTRNVVRDLFYILPTVIVIVLGYYLQKVLKDKYSLINTLILSGGLVALFRIVNVFRNPDIISNFTSMKTNFGNGNYIYEICVVFTVLIFEKIVCNKILFSKWTDRIIMICVVINIALSMGRIAIIQSILGMITVFIFAIIKRQGKKTIIKKASTIIVGLIVGVFLLGKIMPESALKELTDKFSRSSEEISVEQQFESTEDAVENWRGYEMNQAQRQWEKNNIFIELFGEGMGKGVEIQYIPFTWSNMVVSDEIPLLHNGYYTLLSKGGLLGVISLIWLFIANIVLVFRKRYENNMDDLIILAATTIGIMINTYVVRGPITQNPCIVWGIIVGSINYKINHKTTNKLEKDYH